MKLRMHHIPVCPFSQRVEILLALKGLTGKVDFNTIDITIPRPEWLTALSRGSSALPVMEVGDKLPIKESRVILEMVEAMFPDPPVARTDPHEHALESLIVQQEGAFVMAGYSMVMNQDPGKKHDFLDRMLRRYRALNDTLLDYAPGDTFFFDRFGWAEVVYTPFFMRFWFLDYYENFELPSGKDFDRVRRWRNACIEHPSAQQVSFEEIVKVYYDYAKGAGNGALPEGRSRSSFVFEPDWRDRPMPPADKYGYDATDEELGLV